MTDTVQQMKNMVLEVLDKYTFIEEYINAPSILTDKSIPIFVKYMSTILYFRRRLGFPVVPDDEIFYDNIQDNNYTQFDLVNDSVELYKLLVAFVTLACSYVTSKVDDDDDSLNKILPNIRKYLYRNLDFVV